MITALKVNGAEELVVDSQDWEVHLVGLKRFLGGISSTDHSSDPTNCRIEWVTQVKESDLVDKFFHLIWLDLEALKIARMTGVKLIIEVDGEDRFSCRRGEK